MRSLTLASLAICAHTVTWTKIRSAKWFEFMWTKSFSLGFHAPALLPLMMGFIVTTVESIGDIGATMEASKMPSSGADADSRVQGGLLADGIASFASALMTTPPNTTFSQNNGVIAMTLCASRAAGLACGFWLILFGVFGKFAGVISSIPDCVLGGMTTFLFANVLVSGIVIIGRNNVTRRSRFILAVALGVGVGVACEPHFAEGGGVGAFYGGNLKHNIGFWPKSKICKIFPTSTTTITSCVLGNFASSTITEDDCAGINGTFTSTSTTATVESCVGTNGFCCLEYDESKWLWRESVVLLMKTPYCIGTLLAMLLNLLMPYEEEDDEENNDKASEGEAVVELEAIVPTEKGRLEA